MFTVDSGSPPGLPMRDHMTGARVSGGGCASPGLCVHHSGFAGGRIRATPRGVGI